jgi:nucleoside-diphosphate-sugar epimerase
MKVLFIGGTGNISTPCTRLALQKGIEVTVLNRGETQRHAVPEGTRVLHCDIRQPQEVARVLDGEVFDVVVDWIAFTPEHIENDLQLFAGKTKQFIFISSASAYQSPTSRYIITESTPLQNPYWEYSRDKIACEDRLMQAYRDSGFPITIVRPSHTYDTVIPVAVGNWNYTIADRILRGKEIISHGDGNSLWTATHSDDFAKGFVGLLGNTAAIGHAFHITSDEVLTWDQIYLTLADALGVEAKIVHISSDFIAKFDSFTGDNLLGDKAGHGVFDNSKIKSFVPEFKATIPFREGIRRTLRWFDEDPARKTIDEGSNDFIDKCLAAYKSLGAA